MSKKKLFMIIIVAVICVAALSVALVMVRGKKEKSINLGKSSEETDEQSYWNPDIHGIAKSEDGYYYLTYDIDGTTLRYFDDTAKKSIAVCAKPDCTHDSSDCNAFYSMDYLSTPVYYYKGYIYMVRVDAGMAKVVRIQKDGSKREDVADLFASDDGTVSLVFHDDCVYAYDRIGHMGAVESKDTDKVVIVKAELANGKTSEVFSYEGANNAINEARSFGDKLFFLINHNSIDKETLTADVNYKLYCYDYATGSAELVSDKNISDYYVDTDNGILYYFVIDKGLYSRKLNENDGKLLYKADDSIVMAALSYDGKYIYMCNGGAGSATQITNFIDEKIFVLNPDGTLVNTIELDRRKMSNLYYGDDKYLFIGYSNKLSYIDKSNISSSVEIVPVK